MNHINLMKTGNTRVFNEFNNLWWYSDDIRPTMNFWVQILLNKNNPQPNFVDKISRKKEVQKNLKKSK